MQRQIIVHLVEGDDAPDLSIRFTGLVLSDYTSITMRIERADRTRFARGVTPDGSDDELGTVAWQPGDLTSGNHEAEFEFIRASDSKRFTLPSKYPVVLAVRRDLG